jgi:hypothetical protein
VGHSGLVFPNPTQNLEKLLLEEIYLNGVVTLGEAMRAARSRALGTISGQAAAMPWTLLGDPELPVGVPAAPRPERESRVAGRRVRTLIPTVQPDGRRAALWDGRDEAGRIVSPGVYFARLGDGPAAPGGRVVRLR